MLRQEVIFDDKGVHRGRGDGAGAAAPDKGVAEFQLIPDQAALVMIDMQDESVRPGWTPYRISEATRQVPRLVRQFQRPEQADMAICDATKSSGHTHTESAIFSLCRSSATGWS